MQSSSVHISSNIINRLSKVGALIGNTPYFPISNLYQKTGVQIFAKLDWHQLGSSIKSRPAFSIIRNAILSGQLNGKRRLLDASSGNTGIAYATIGAALDIPVTICLPENASVERKQILTSLGAEIIFTSRFEGTDGAQQVAKEMYLNNTEAYFYANQYANDYNWKAHFLTTAPEIWNQSREGITHFVAGLGTTGTITGTGRKLKQFNPDIQIVALQPDNPMHGLEGWKHLETAIVPGIFDETLPDQFLEVETFEAYDMVKLIARKEGLLVSPSAAANLVGAIQVAESIRKGVVVTTFSDNAEKYSEIIKSLF